jgi:hypothetical protein
MGAKDAVVLTGSYDLLGCSVWVSAVTIIDI